MKRLAPLCAAALTLAGCAGSQQSAVDPAGIQADRIAGLWWWMLGLLGAIYVIVAALAVFALVRRRRQSETGLLEQTHMPSLETEARLTRNVAAAVILTAVILFGLIVASASAGRAISSLGEQRNGLTVQVVGNQWWWEVRYWNSDPRQIAVTANEIHIPVGRPVMIRAESRDVIHSFWAPNLHGKIDLIPGRVNTQWLQADRPGRFRAQCAEFCGLQHAHMALWVVAEPQGAFQNWLNAQLAPAPPPVEPRAQRGQQVFLENACVFCHSIQGTPAAGRVAPDLTHLASRLTIAAGTLPNTRENLRNWITDPQRMKPGNHMAVIGIKAEDLDPLLDYLEGLR